MKKTLNLFCLAILLLFPFLLNAQDTIIFRNGNELVVKVTEVSDTYVKYNLWNNLGGPTYSKNISDIFVVKYKGGHKEVYGNVEVKPGNNATTSSTIVAVPQKYRNSKMSRDGDDLQLDGKDVDEALLRTLLSDDEFATYRSAHRQFRIGRGLMVPGIVLSGISTGFWLAGGILMSISTDYSDILIGYDLYATGWAFFSVGQGFLAGGIPLMIIGGKRMNWVADSFNQRASGSNLSLSVAPMMFRNPDKSSLRGIAFGAGLTLNF